MGIFDGRVALVTGAARGIGEATARALAAEGAQVICADIHDPGEVAAAIGGEPLLLDVTDTAGWVASAARWPIDVAVLNAGVGLRKPFLEITDAEFDRVLGINLRSVMVATRELGRSMATRGGGAISVTASMGGLIPHPQSPTYATSKWGVVGFVRSVAAELSESGVRLAAVCPALVDTPILGPGMAEQLRGWGMQLLDASEVAAAHMASLQADPGTVLAVQVGRGVNPFPPMAVEGYQSGPPPGAAGGPPSGR
jgi:3alpha(or 20beta)-hydroxysteroid dehydrogenase